MPAQETWELIGWSFLPLALGLGLLALALLVAKRWWLRVPAFLMVLPPLALWLVLVFVAAYPTIHQTDEGPRGCFFEGVEVECPPEFQQRHGGGE
jgi:hypothetical protein